MEIKKFTNGCVEQIFDDNKCINQRFVAGDEVEYLNDLDKVLDPNFVKDHVGTVYQPFNMVQPNTEIVITVQGGLISDVTFPDGLGDVKIVVKDYDTDGSSEDVKQDDDGEYVESEWV